MLSKVCYLFICVCRWCIIALEHWITYTCFQVNCIIELDYSSWLKRKSIWSVVRRPTAQAWKPLDFKLLISLSLLVRWEMYLSWTLPWVMIFQLVLLLSQQCCYFAAFYFPLFLSLPPPTDHWKTKKQKRKPHTHLCNDTLNKKSVICVILSIDSGCHNL